jgi:hypothetical protein
MNERSRLGILTLILGGLAMAAQAATVVTESLDNVSVSYPGDAARKLPLVVFAHNGGATKEDWGDFPAALAGQGYVVVNIGWTSMGGPDELVPALKKAIAKYGDRIDLGKAALVGGCHGGAKLMGDLMGPMPIETKAIVLLSLSEMSMPPYGHAPVLGFYSARDHLGDSYIKTQRLIYDGMLTDPKRVFVMDSTAHGNELVTDESTKAQVRDTIVAFLAELLK